jgi:hypothetical protein
MVVAQDQTLQAGNGRKVLQTTYLIVRQIDRIEFILEYSNIFYSRYFQATKVYFAIPAWIEVMCGALRDSLEKRNKYK